jgi:RNA polymerase sigma factor FliA
MPTLSEDARRDLVNEHLPLVRSLAIRFYRQSSRFLELDELVSVGTLGLIEAARRYRPEIGSTFATFAYTRVRGAMFDAVGQIAPMRRSAFRALGRLRLRPIVAREMRDDSIDEVADALDSRRAGARLAQALDRLPERKRRLIHRHYFEGDSLLDVGRDLGISKSWASRMHAQALRQLRSLVTSRDIAASA